SLGGARARPGDRGSVLRRGTKPDRRPPRRLSLRGALDDRRPLGPGAGQRAGQRVRDRRRARSEEPSRLPRADSLARQPAPRCIRMGRELTTQATDKRRLILDAAVRVFARQGFHTCRVSDIADEAGVAYGLVYHYFNSKEEILDTLFLDRWDVMLGAIAEADAAELSAREKLYAIASFIVDSYRRDPELMKVIIVEVTRAANTFGRTHLEKIRDAYRQIAAIVGQAQHDGVFRSEIKPEFAALAFCGAVEQVLTGWIFDSVPVGDDELERAKTLIVETICRGIE